MQLSGSILYTLCLGAHGRHLLDLNQIRVLRQSLRLLRSRQLDVQDAILELCVDVFLLHIAHVETARAGAGEGFAPQIAALLILFIVAVAAHCLNGQVAVFRSI